MKKATSKKIAKTVKNLSKKVNKYTKKNPGATITVAATVTATSAIGIGTVVTGLVRLPGVIKKRFAKVDLPADNQNNDDNTDADNNNNDDIIEDNNADNNDDNNDDNTDADNTDEE